MSGAGARKGPGAGAGRGPHAFAGPGRGGPAGPALHAGKGLRKACVCWTRA